jgi:hypothetical protein
VRLPVVQPQLGVEAGRGAHLAHAAFQDSNRLLFFQTGVPEVYETLQISTQVYSANFRDNADILTVPRKLNKFVRKFDKISPYSRTKKRIFANNNFSANLASFELSIVRNSHSPKFSVSSKYLLYDTFGLYSDPAHR